MKRSRPSLPCASHPKILSQSSLDPKGLTNFDAFTRKASLDYGVPIPDRIQGPGDAIGALHRLLQRTPNIYFRSRDVADDLVTLRSIYQDDRTYTAVVVAFWKEIRRALRDPANYGGELRHNLDGVRRSKFSAEHEQDAVLRLLIRPYRDGMQIIALRHRHDPPDMYALAAQWFAEIQRPG